jgi:hypothetical protein
MSVEEGISKYYELKAKYTQDYERKKETVRKNEDMSLAEKREKIRGIARSCIVCGSSEGTNFTEQGRTLSAICGNRASPCSLNINITKPSVKQHAVVDEQLEASIAKLKDDVILSKYNILFNFSSFDDAFVNRADEIRKKIKEFDDLKRKYGEIHKKATRLDERKEEQAKMEYEFLVKVGELKTILREPDNYVGAVTHYDDLMVPMLNKIRGAKYDYIDVISETDDGVVLVKPEKGENMRLIRELVSLGNSLVTVTPGSVNSMEFKKIAKTRKSTIKVKKTASKGTLKKKPVEQAQSPTSNKWSPPTYPFRSFYLPSFQTMAENLIREKKERDVNGNPAWSSERGDNGRMAVVRRTFPADNYASDAITDLVVEPVRIYCKEKKSDISPAEKWDEMVASGDYVTGDPEKTHEKIYDMVRGCNLFNITLGIYLLTGDKGNPEWAPMGNSGPGDVLDPASGWGDRLGAAFIAGATSYRGWDTNEKLQPVYAELAKNYEAAGLKLDWSVTPAPFEDAELGREFFDTVMTSPPFYDQELYEGTSTSTTRYTSRQDWIDKYYKPMWQKSARALRTGGRVIAYISPGWMFDEADKALREMGLAYVGSVGFLQSVEGQADGYIRDAYIWR